MIVTIQNMWIPDIKKNPLQFIIFTFYINRLNITSKTRRKFLINNERMTHTNFNNIKTPQQSLSSISIQLTGIKMTT